MNLTLNIDRNLLEKVRPFVADAMEGMQAVAQQALPHVARMENLEFGQSEVLMRSPLRQTWFVLKNPEGYWISDREFFPF